jgi:hypothetical protein
MSKHPGDRHDGHPVARFVALLEAELAGVVVGGLADQVGLGFLAPVGVVTVEVVDRGGDDLRLLSVHPSLGHRHPDRFVGGQIIGQACLPRCLGAGHPGGPGQPRRERPGPDRTGQVQHPGVPDHAGLELLHPGDQPGQPRRQVSRGGRVERPGRSVHEARELGLEQRDEPGDGVPVATVAGVLAHGLILRATTDNRKCVRPTCGWRVTGAEALLVCPSPGVDAGEEPGLFPMVGEARRTQAGGTSRPTGGPP